MEFLVKDMHNAGIHGEGISVLQAGLALRVCSGRLCGRTAGEAVGWCERSWRMKNRDPSLSYRPLACHGNDDSVSSSMLQPSNQIVLAFHSWS